MILYRLSSIALLLLMALLIVFCFVYEILRSKIRKDSLRKIIDILTLVISVLGILKFCVFGRMVSDIHVFAFWGNEMTSRDFWKEMELNVLLYLPFGAMVIHYLKKTWMVGCLALVLSTCIEFWQYLFGTGKGQITDIICNTAGALLGCIGYLCFLQYRKRISKEK